MRGANKTVSCDESGLVQNNTHARTHARARTRTLCSPSPTLATEQATPSCLHNASEPTLASPPTFTTPPPLPHPLPPPNPQVCGNPGVDGDFIVPTQAAHLDGAINLEIDGAFHSPLGAKLEFFGPWYGSEEFLDQWVHWLDEDWGALSSGEGTLWSFDDEDAVGAGTGVAEGAEGEGVKRAMPVMVGGAALVRG